MEKEQTTTAKTFWKGEFYVCVVIRGCSVMVEQGIRLKQRLIIGERENWRKKPTEDTRPGCLFASCILGSLHTDYRENIP